MEIVGGVLLFGGLLLAIIIQIYIGVLAFRDNPTHTLFFFILPHYVSFYAWHNRKEPKLFRALLTWGIALVMFIIGIIILSVV